MKFLYRQLLLTVCLLVSSYGNADICHLYTPDKLSSGLITCICQDVYGYIWIGTEYGLNKFDGYRYTVYHHNRKDSTTITDNEVSSLFVDRQGRLWVGGSKGLSRYDYEHDRFVRYTFPENRSPRVSTLLESPKGDLLIGTAGYGLFSIKHGDDNIYYEGPFCRRPIDDFFSRAHIDQKGNLWRSNHNNMLTRFVVKDGKLDALCDYLSICGQPVSYVEYSPLELLIICMYGMMSYNYQTGELRLADFDISSLDRNVSLRKAKMDRWGNLYIATAGGGLMVIPKGEKRLQRIENMNTPIDMSSANVVDIMEDNNANLWVACYNKGLMVISKKKESFTSWRFSNHSMMISGSITSIVGGEEEDIWCTVQNNGIFRLDKSGHIIEHPVSPAGTRIIYRDRNGKYWLTTENTLYDFNPKTGRATMERSFGGKGLNCMADDGKGRLYISVFGQGLYIYDTHTHVAQQVSMQQKGRKGGYLCNDWIKAMTFDHRGMLWLATTNGVSMMNPDGMVFNNRGWNTLLEGNQCYAFCETSDGDMLISSGSGIFRYRWKDNQVEEEPKTRDLTDKMVCAMVRDNQGDVWISTTGGIWLLSERHQEMVGYIGGNGLMTKEYVLGASLHRQDDRVFFGTADGITSFQPQDIISHKKHLVKVYLTRFYCHGHVQNPLTNDYRLSNEDNTFTLEFSTLDYLNAENIAFQYRVNGKAWMETDEGVNQMTFTQLAAGQYTIEVRAVCNGVISDDIHLLHITILHPWYLSWWACLMYVVVLGVVILMVYFHFVQQRKREMEETKMQYLINAAHDLRTPLTMIKGPLDKLKTRLTDPVNQTELDTIDRNTNCLLKLVNQILDERKIDKHQLKLSCSYTNLNSFIKNICVLFEYNAAQRGISFRFEGPEIPVRAWVDHMQFDKVISNLLSNAFKYTSDHGEILVRLSQPKGEHMAVIEVIDNGLGFEDDHTEKLFECFYQGKNSRDLHVDGTGIGLNLCRTLTEMHGGRIYATNRTDGTRGAVLTIQLPLGKGHLDPSEIAERKHTKGNVTHDRKQASNNIKILVVDDHPEIGRYIIQELGRYYRFDYASNGAEAMKKLLTKHYDLVVSDVKMPVMDGFDLLRCIRANLLINEIPVILLTSQAEVASRLEGLNKGADAYIAKPFTMEVLQVRIDNLINKVRQLKGKFSVVLQQGEEVEVPQRKSQDEELRDSIIRCINDHLSDADFGVDDLCNKVGISRSRLYTKVKEMTGVSVCDLIQNIRMEQAARLIKEGKNSVSQVAYRVGFNSQTHFSTIFKKHFGLSPTEFAETEKQQENTNKRSQSA